LASASSLDLDIVYATPSYAIGKFPVHAENRFRDDELYARDHMAQDGEAARSLLKNRIRASA
jgi:hypothetical protein